MPAQGCIQLRLLYLSRGQVVLHADDMEVVVADGGYEAAGPGSIAQQGGGVGAVGNDMVMEGENLDEAQAEEAVVAAHHHVHQWAHHQQQTHHLSMLACVYGLQPCRNCRSCWHARLNLLALHKYQLL